MTPDKSKSNTKHTAQLWLRSLGPGLVTAALVFGPSKMTITSKLGADYGFQLLWIVVIATFFMIIFTGMTNRIGLSTTKSLLHIIRERWGKGISVAVGLGVFFVATSFQSGNAVGVGISIAEINGTSATPWIILFTIIGIGLLFLKDLYKVLEKLMIVMIVLMLFAFVTTLFFIKPDITGIVDGFIPRIPSESVGLVIAFFASCFSIVGAFYQAYLVQEKRKLRTSPDQHGNSNIIGILLLGFMSAMVMIAAAAVLHADGITVTNALDMAKALEPIFGGYASYIFLLGLFGASFSSLIGNATIGGTLLGDAFGISRALDTKVIRFFIALVMVIGSVIAIVFGKMPLELIVMAQSVTIFLVPFIGIAIYLISSDPRIMGYQVNNTVTKIWGIIGLMILILLAVRNLQELFF
ncbi:Nramp family divalent metal transporter [Olivibacter sp. SDN3]|nr:Nramp family divalent metal transporter [Olivibacter sp. SDN3]